MKSIPLNDRLARTLLSRLERMSADSHWAHRASGIRGSLIALLGQQERGEPVDSQRLRFLVEAGFDLLQRAAAEKAGR